MHSLAEVIAPQPRWPRPMAPGQNPGGTSGRPGRPLFDLSISGTAPRGGGPKGAEVGWGGLVGAGPEAWPCPRHTPGPGAGQRGRHTPARARPRLRARDTCSGDLPCSLVWGGGRPAPTRGPPERSSHSSSRWPASQRSHRRRVYMAPWLRCRVPARGITPNTQQGSMSNCVQASIVLRAAAAPASWARH